MRLTISSERLATMAAASLAVSLLGLFGYLAATTSGSNNSTSSNLLTATTTSNCVRARGESPSSFLEGVGYSKLRAAVIELYYASDPETTDLEEQFDDALMAMELVERDGHPVPIDGVDGLYVGSIGAAYNLPALQQAGITHILSLEPAGSCKWPNLFSCLHIDTLYDNSKPENNISQYFDRTLPFIDHALKKGGRVLVHCWRGKSRSVSTIIAYLIQEYRWTPDYALDIIHETRPIADPNDGYWQELEDFYDATVGKHAHHVEDDDEVNR
ncbi:dual specificity phosphatase [Nitzschia inconspicua]|uniref:protein-tyrosine-phosphatase n=1 Tax=Nitzschia inconspicua TaxID=303405 RepID=A0A9K3KK88_9STRA|nr:dual specificity phosphatase [Nitzschia inconspicua]